MLVARRCGCRHRSRVVGVVLQRRWVTGLRRQEGGRLRELLLLRLMVVVLLLLRRHKRLLQHRRRYRLLHVHRRRVSVAGNGKRARHTKPEHGIRRVAACIARAGERRQLDGRGAVVRGPRGRVVGDQRWCTVGRHLAKGRRRGQRRLDQGRVTIRRGVGGHAHVLTLIHGLAVVLLRDHGVRCVPVGQRVVVCRRRRQAGDDLAGHRRLMADLELSAALLGAPPPTVHAPIPPVLDGIVTATAQATRNLGPSLAHLGHHLLDEEAFLRGDGLVIEVGLQVLVEALATLLGGTGLNCRRNAHPVVRSVDVDQVQEILVLGLGPRSSFVLRHGDL